MAGTLWLQRAFALFALALAVFVVVSTLVAVYDITLSTGFCCADDAYFAMIAKTFAERGRYGLPISEVIVSPFDPTIGVGPALILPEAVMIRLLGADFRVPGLTAILLQGLQLLGLLIVLARRSGVARGALYVGAVFVLQLHFSARNFYFGIGVGEVPMLGFLMLGIALLATDIESRRSVLAGGICLSLAILTKQTAIYPVAAIGAAWSIHRLLLERWVAWRSIARLAGAVALPLLLFEFIRWRTLGTHGYLVNWHYIALMAKGLGSDSAAPWTLVEILWKHYRIGADILALAAVSLALVFLGKPVAPKGPAGFNPRRMAYMILAAMAATALAFVWSRWTNDRYAWSIPMLLCMLLPLPLLACRPLPAAALAAAIVVVLGPDARLMDRLLSPAGNFRGQNVRIERERRCSSISPPHPPRFRSTGRAGTPSTTSPISCRRTGNGRSATTRTRSASATLSTPCPLISRTRSSPSTIGFRSSASDSCPI